MSQAKFDTLALKTDLLENLQTLGYHSMTPIQAKSIPHILKGVDVIAQGQTGSGKTAAFALGLLNKLQVKKFRIQTLVLCPTRELADQVSNEIRKLARSIHNIKVLTLCGGMPFGPQVGSLEHGAHIIVGTPGRIVDHISRGTLDLSNVDTLVLDEADRMLEMGFQDSLEEVLAEIPKQKQTLMFSATFSPQIESIAQRYMVKPAMVEAESTHDENSIQQRFYKVDGANHRASALKYILLEHQPESAIVFCNTKKDTQAVADSLSHFGFTVLSLHGDLEQRDRDRAIIMFSNKSANILVATDVAARGLDIDSVELVVNYDMAHDTDTHTHRVGRTGRAGNQGIACSLFSDRESHKVELLDLPSDPVVNYDTLPDKDILNVKPRYASFKTIQIDGGKKQKVRAGDILGALTAGKEIDGKLIGKINLFDNWAYVAVNEKIAKKAFQKISQGKLKGRSFRARLLHV
ncbi:ATP-dependent RNA helicase DbpA [Catenovulum maritimum]|uniref:DEAD-box ATP-dependent RNA helicase RhpA n=1 Tax=Catenovulum maritimum TaxID=1513271 RepID=A0A0J8JL49_9ALTE|nr:ATP-dependent RNA helicase DbpA [Catenovulum maritimum]KMT65281.1 DEAD/DEAH box helicase [Catenovulum maritimum]